jgi:hypothetical protein
VRRRGGERAGRPNCLLARTRSAATAHTRAARPRRLTPRQPRARTQNTIAHATINSADGSGRPCGGGAAAESGAKNSIENCTSRTARPRARAAGTRRPPPTALHARKMSTRTRYSARAACGGSTERAATRRRMCRQTELASSHASAPPPPRTRAPPDPARRRRAKRARTHTTCARTRGEMRACSRLTWKESQPRRRRCLGMRAFLHQRRTRHRRAPRRVHTPPPPLVRHAPRSSRELVPLRCVRKRKRQIQYQLLRPRGARSKARTRWK